MFLTSKYHFWQKIWIVYPKVVLYESEKYAQNKHRLHVKTFRKIFLESVWTYTEFHRWKEYKNILLK